MISVNHVEISLNQYITKEEIFNIIVIFSIYELIFLVTIVLT